MKVVIIGGGIIGLSSAYYLQQSGHEVIVIDKADMNNNCSYGNAGYVCPSHFTQLATPGIVQQGLKWMFNSSSPFYVQPRLDKNLINWGWKFIQSATKERVAKAAVPLRDIALLSQSLYEEWTRLPQFSFAYEHKGLLEIFQTKEKQEHARHIYEKALQLGLNDTEFLNYEQLQALEPQTQINALGAIFFKCDAHLYPQKLMQQMIAHLKNVGVKICVEEEVIGFEQQQNSISKIITNQKDYAADVVIMASGSWSKSLAAKLNINFPLMPGRGYSVTVEDEKYAINYPAILMEGRVALTPMDGNKTRFGGTMEITNTNTPPRANRVAGLLAALKKFYPAFDIPQPSIDKVWYGFRPCSADGLPYIGKIKQYKNLVIATGHSMLGLSLGAGTGKLVSEIVNENQLSMDITSFNPNRFN
jgi:D-amino-acid dehydrogenase